MKKILASFIFFFLILFDSALKGQSIELLISKTRTLSESDTTYINYINIIADSMLTYDKIDSGLFYINAAIDASTKIRYIKGEARARYLKGRAFIAQSKNAIGIESIVLAQSLYDSINNQSGIADCILQSGVVAYSQNDYKRALDYFNDAEKKYSLVKNTFGSSRSLYLIGLCHTNLGSYSLAENDLAHALSEMENLGYQKGMIECRDGLANLYLRMGEYSKAITYFEECLDYFQSKGDIGGIAKDKSGIGEVYLKTGQTLLAKKILTEAYQLSKQVNYHDVILNSSQALSSIFLAEGDFENALKYQNEYYLIRDTIINLINTRSIDNLQSKLDLTLAESENNVKSKQLQVYKIRQIILIIGIVFFFILAFLLFQRFLYKRNAHEKLENAHKELQSVLSELKSTQEQLIQNEKMASLGQLTAGIAHEINNPVNFVSATVSPLRKDLSDILNLIRQYESLEHTSDLTTTLEKIKAFKSEIDINYTINETEKLIKGIEEGASRTAEIVKGLRNFSRMDEDVMKPIDVNNGINATLLLVKNKLNEKKIVIEKHLSEIPKINAHAGQLNQVFMNLMVNAIDAFEKMKPPSDRSIQKTIIISSIFKDNKVLITIKDNGVGMNEKVKQKIFDPFFTTKEIGKGTGLGLSISYGIVEKHNGKIEVKSEEGKGTEFVISLPV